jgi:hypothetical protein
MIRIASNTDGTEVDLSGSAFELGDVGKTIAEWTRSDSPRLVINADTDFDPTPFEVVLCEIVLCRTCGPIRLAVQDGALQASGSATAFAFFSPWFEFQPDARDGYHIHFDNVWGNDYIDQSTIPLVIRCRTQ